MKVFFISILILFIATGGFAQSLREALAKEDTVLAAKLIKEGADPDEKDTYGTTPLMHASHFPNLPAARLLLSHGASVNARSPKGRTPLMVACAYWCGTDMVSLLVEKGSDVNATSQDGTTALMLAAQNEKLDVVEYLLAKGADANKKNNTGKAAIDFARAGKVEDYMLKSIKDTRFDKEKVIEMLEMAMKKSK